MADDRFWGRSGFGVAIKGDRVGFCMLHDVHDNSHRLAFDLYLSTSPSGGVLADIYQFNPRRLFVEFKLIDTDEPDAVHGVIISRRSWRRLMKRERPIQSDVWPDFEMLVSRTATLKGGPWGHTSTYRGSIMRRCCMMLGRPTVPSHEHTHSKFVMPGQLGLLEAEVECCEINSRWLHNVYGEVERDQECTCFFPRFRFPSSANSQ